MMKSNKFIIVALLVLAVTMIFFIKGYLNRKNSEEGILHSIPSSAEILFLSDRDTGHQGREIYSMSVDGKDITRITYLNGYFGVFGIDRSKKHIVATIINQITKRKSLWILDLKTGEIRQLTDPKNDAEGNSFSPDGEWVVFHMVVAGENQADIYIK